MKSVLHYTLLPIVLLAPFKEALAHIDGVHSGGLLQSLMHLLQSPEHLTILLVTAVVVSLLVRNVIRKRN